MNAKRTVLVVAHVGRPAALRSARLVVDRLTVAGVAVRILGPEAADLRCAGAAATLGLGVAGVTPSELPGPSGNVEYFLWMRRGAPPLDPEQLRQVISGGPQ